MSFLIAPLAKWLLGRSLFGKTIGEGAASFFAWAIVALAAILLAIGGWEALKHSIIANHDATATAKAAAQQVRRTDAADVDQMNRAAATENRSDQLQGELDNAIHSDPAGGNSVAGPGANAVLGELRRRQGARR